MNAASPISAQVAGSSAVIPEQQRIQSEMCGVLHELAEEADRLDRRLHEALVRIETLERERRELLGFICDVAYGKLPMRELQQRAAMLEANHV